MCTCVLSKKSFGCTRLTSRRGWNGVLCVVWGDSDEYTIVAMCMAAITYPRVCGHLQFSATP